MITDIIVSAVEDSLDEITGVDAHIVPLLRAFPSSGKQFVQVVGTNNSFKRHEHSLKVRVNIQITCSFRTRNYPVETKYKPYLDLVDLAERCYFHIITRNSLTAAIRSLLPNFSFSGPWTSPNLITTPIQLPPSYYESPDQARYASTTTRGGDSRRTEREAGLSLQQVYSSPLISIPFQALNSCLALPAPLDEISMDE
jgi:hypothetical protein